VTLGGGSLCYDPKESAGEDALLRPTLVGWVRLAPEMQSVTPPDPAGWSIGLAADVASLVGVVITIIGFAVTIWTVLKSKSAAERAEQAARTARSNLLRVDSIAGISAAITGFEDLKRLHRTGSWDGMPERYAVQRRSLIAVRSGSMTLTDAQKAILQSAVQQLSFMEKQIEAHLAHPEDVPDRAKFNGIVSKQTGALTRVLGSIGLQRVAEGLSRVPGSRRSSLRLKHRERR
jgi:hypothetical protein